MNFRIAKREIIFYLVLLAIEIPFGNSVKTPVRNYRRQHALIGLFRNTRIPYKTSRSGIYKRFMY
jgi:hypothetical protein